MAMSAFGVDHGEVSKAMPKIPSFKAIGQATSSGLQRAGSSMGAFGSKGLNFAGGKKPGMGASARRGVGYAGYGLHRAGQVTGGANAEKTGMGIATGGAALGAGGLGHM